MRPSLGMNPTNSKACMVLFDLDQMGNSSAPSQMIGTFRRDKFSRQKKGRRKQKYHPHVYKGVLKTLFYFNANL